MIFSEIIKSILNPEDKWERSKGKIFFNSDLRYEISFNKPFEDIVIRDNGQIFLELTREEKLILIRALGFVLGGIPAHYHEIQKEIKQISLKEYYPTGGRKKIEKIEKRKIKKINVGLMTNKKKNQIQIIKRPREEDIFVSEGLGTIGDLFSNENSNTVSISYDKEFEDRDDKPFFKKRIVGTRKNEKENIESLVLWDIENVSFYNDVTLITRALKHDKQLKVVSYFQKNNASKSHLQGNIEFRLRQMRKRNWHIVSTKTIADKVLIDTYEKHKENIKELILVSGDSDFKGIIQDALKRGIEIKIMNNANHKNAWYSNMSEYIKIEEYNNE